MRIIIYNDKGGAGKSTTSVQVIAPFMYILNGETKPVNLFEFDDSNADSETFESSEILYAKRIMVSGNDLDNKVTNITIDNDSLILDVGGNMTSKLILQALELSGMLDLYDLVVIPLMDGEQDALNARRAYSRIRQSNNNIKIVFALSRIDISMQLSIQYIDWFGDKQGRLDDRVGIIESIKKEDRNIIKIFNSETIKYSRAFGQTVFELSNKDINTLKEKIQKSLKEDDKNRIKKLSYRLTILNKSIRYREVLQECFDTLNEVLKNQPSTNKKRTYNEN